MIKLIALFVEPLDFGTGYAALNVIPRCHRAFVGCGQAAKAIIYIGNDLRLINLLRGFFEFRAGIIPTVYFRA